MAGGGVARTGVSETDEQAHRVLGRPRVAGRLLDRPLDEILDMGEAREVGVDVLLRTVDAASPVSASSPTTGTTSDTDDEPGDEG